MVEKKEMVSIQEESQCPLASGYCLAREAADRLGVAVFAVMMTFICAAEPGASLVLERIRTGFSLQTSEGALTGPVVGMGPEHMRHLRERLEILRRIIREE